MGAEERINMRHFATYAVLALCVVASLGNVSSTEEDADAITEVFDEAYSPEQALIDQEELVQRRSPYLKYVMNNFLNKNERKRALQIEQEVDHVHARHVQARMQALESAKNSLVKPSKAAKLKKAALKKVKQLAKKKALKKSPQGQKGEEGCQKEADKSEESWVHKEKAFRKEARTLNKDQRWFARRIERQVKVMQKWHVKTTANDLEHMRKLAKDETKYMAKGEAFKAKMHKIQVQMATENAKAKEASTKRLVKYKAQAALDAQKLAKFQKEHETYARSVQSANKKLKVEQKKLNDEYKERTLKLDAKDRKDNHKFDKEQKKAQKKFAKLFKDKAEEEAAAQAAIVQSIKSANKEAKQKKNRIIRRISKEQASKKKTDVAYEAKKRADAQALKFDRAKTAEKFAKKAMQSDLVFHRAMQEAGQKKEKVKRAIFAEKSAKSRARKHDKSDEKETKAAMKSDGSIRECALDGSECQTPDGKCHKTSPTGPYMAADLVSCSNRKPKDDADAGLKWAGIEPPLPAEKCPPVTKRCKTLTRACAGQRGCAVAQKLGPLKGTEHVGCKEGKQELDLWLDMHANCCDKTMIGFSDNVPMFKMQIFHLPDYIKSSIKASKFEANSGAGSVCHMVKSLVKGIQSGLDEHDADLDKKANWDHKWLSAPNKDKFVKHDMKHVKIFKFVKGGN